MLWMNTVYVTVHQLDKLGDLLDATVQAGANNVNSIQFDVADKSTAITKLAIKLSRMPKPKRRSLHLRQV